MAEKKTEFVVTDRRRFGTEGEPRPDAQVAEEDKPATPAQANQAGPAAANTSAPAKPPVAAPPAQHGSQPAQPVASEASAAPQHEEEMPAPPSAEEQRELNEAYKEYGKQIDKMIAAAGHAGEGPMEMNFEAVVQSISLSALVQLGLYPPGTEARRIDIIGARQSIDSLEVLQEKTKGNLTDSEKAMLQDVLFQLRMNFIEVTNYVAKSATKPGAVPPGVAPPLDRK
jgi:hypothetical protein